MNNKYVFEKQIASEQVIQDEFIADNIVEPFISFDELLSLYYVNAYHRRAIQIKAHLLSQIVETDLSKYLPNDMDEKQFLFAFALNLELFGNAFIEIAGTSNSKTLYILPTIEARIDINFNIYQKKSFIEKPLEGVYLKYYSPASRYYGEPDYLSVFMQITLEDKINQYNNAFFDNGAKPDFAIIFEGAEPSDEQLNAFKEFFETSYKGYLNAHKTLVISAPSSYNEQTAKIKIERLNNVEDMSFEKLKKVNRDEIIAAHGVPPRLVGVVTPGQIGSSNELISQLHAFNETTIKPKIQLIEQFFQKNGIKLKLSCVDTTNFKDDSDVISELVKLGIISVSEARDILGWQKKEINDGLG